MTTTDLFGRIKTSRGLYFLYGNGFTDTSETELKIQDIAGNLISVGEHLQGQAIQELAIMCSDGSILTTATIYSKDSGKIANWRGNERTTEQFYNLEAKNLNIPMEKGVVLKVNTGD